LREAFNWPFSFRTPKPHLEPHLQWGRACFGRNQPQHAGDRCSLLIEPDGRVVPLHFLRHVPGQRAPYHRAHVRQPNQVGERVAQAVDGEALVDLRLREALRPRDIQGVGGAVRTYLGRSRVEPLHARHRRHSYDGLLPSFMRDLPDLRWVQSQTTMRATFRSRQEQPLDEARDDLFDE
jgi:hypothetical protein